MSVNMFGLAIVILMLVPNTVYVYKNPQIQNKCTSKLMNIVEQVGRYGTMLLMGLTINVAAMGFSSYESFALWIIIEASLLLFYYFFWFIYAKKPTMSYALVLAIIPSAIFILTGLFSRYYLLVTMGMIFCVGHIYVTVKNHTAD